MVARRSAIGPASHEAVMTWKGYEHVARALYGEAGDAAGLDAKGRDAFALALMAGFVRDNPGFDRVRWLNLCGKLEAERGAAG